MNILVLLHYFNIWITDVKYEGYKCNDIVVSKNITYEKLISVITAELEIDESREKLEDGYVVEGNSTSFGGVIIY